MVPFGHFANKNCASKTVAHIRLTSSYGFSLLQTHFG